jgi:hypothetical protein
LTFASSRSKLEGAGGCLATIERNPEKLEIEASFLESYHTDRDTGVNYDATESAPAASDSGPAELL